MSKARAALACPGSILLAMNPFEALSIYSEDLMAKYKGMQLGKVGCRSAATR